MGKTKFFLRKLEWKIRLLFGLFLLPCRKVQNNIKVIQNPIFFLNLHLNEILNIMVIINELLQNGFWKVVQNLFPILRYPSSRSSTIKSYAATGSNLYPETTIREPVDRSGTIPSRSTLHSLRNIEGNNVGRNSTMTSRDSNRDPHSRAPSLFSRNNQDPDLTSFKTLEDDDYGFKSRFSSSQVRTKGQIISEWCLRFSKLPMKIFDGFLPWKVI